MKQNQIERMLRFFRKAGLDPDERQIEQFTLLHDLLVTHNEAFDLTRLRSFDDIIMKHFIDSVYFTRFAELPESLVDIGTGPGFPGVPLKIMNPELRLVLAEPKARRVTFLGMVIEELGLDNTEVYPHLVTEKSFFNVDGVITRALESVNGTLSRVNHFLPEGGKVFFMKGPEADTDLNDIDEKNSMDFSLSTDRKYRLPDTTHERRILVFTKTGTKTSRAHHIFKDAAETLGTPITSADNKTFKDLKKLTAPAGMKKAGAMLLSGRKLVAEALADETRKKQQLVLFDGYKETDTDLNDRYEEYASSGRLLILKKSLYNELDLFNTGGPLLVTDMPVMEEWTGPSEPGCYLVVPFQDPQNVGTVIRSAAGFGVSGIILLREAAHPFHPRAVRASSGAVFSAPLFRGPSIREFLEDTGDIRLVALDRGGSDIRDFTFPETFYLLPGLEGPGLPDELRAEALSIPLSGDIESLNAAMAATLALYEWKRQKH